MKKQCKEGNIPSFFSYNKVVIYINKNYIENYILNPTSTKKVKRLLWYELWQKKSNYIEYYYNKIKNKYKIIDESINYYIGMLEKGIIYLKKYDNYYEYYYLQHKIFLNDNSSDLSNLKADIKERDCSEYLKYLFFKQDYDEKAISDFILKTNNKFNYDLVIARLLYPSYYLFFLEKFITEKVGYDDLNRIICRSKEYELYVNSIVLNINKYYEKKIGLPF